MGKHTEEITIHVKDIHEAVRILNNHNYLDCDKWEYDAEFGAIVDYFDPYSFDADTCIPADAAIRVATTLELQKYGFKVSSAVDSSSQNQESS